MTQSEGLRVPGGLAITVQKEKKKNQPNRWKYFLNAAGQSKLKTHGNRDIAFRFSTHPAIPTQRLKPEDT